VHWPLVVEVASTHNHNQTVNTPPQPQQQVKAGKEEENGEMGPVKGGDQEKAASTNFFVRGTCVKSNSKFNGALL